VGGGKALDGALSVVEQDPGVSTIMEREHRISIRRKVRQTVIVKIQLVD
jgi:hypothetical protein